jgi:hypothetical protein
VWRKLNCVVESLVGRRKEKGRTNCCFLLQRGMQGTFFIPESWMEVATWVEEVQLVAMEITKGKLGRVGCTIQRVKQHYEDCEDLLHTFTTKICTHNKKPGWRWNYYVV